MALPAWMEAEFATTLRMRLDRLASARGGSPQVVDHSLDELRKRLASRKWTGRIERALAGEDSKDTRLALTALAMRICKRRIADELRQTWRRKLLVMRNEEAMISGTVGSSAPQASPEIRELLGVVLDAVDRLNDEDREIIAEVIDIELGARAESPEPASSTERARLHRARARLSAEIAKRGGGGGER